MAQEPRNIYGQCLMELAEKDKNIVVLDADLSLLLRLQWLRRLIQVDTLMLVLQSAI